MHNTASIFYLATSMMSHMSRGRFKEALSLLREIEDYIIMELDKK